MTLGKSFNTKSNMSQKGLLNDMVLTTTKPLHQLSNLNPYVPYFTSPHPLTGISTSSILKPFSYMAFYPRLKQCLWNNHLALKLLARKTGLWNWWNLSTAWSRLAAYGTKLSTKQWHSGVLNDSHVNGAYTKELLPPAQSFLQSTLTISLLQDHLLRKSTTSATSSNHSGKSQNWGNWT